MPPSTSSRADSLGKWSAPSPDAARRGPLAWIAALPIAAIFYGDVWIGITLPLALILSPFLFFRADGASLWKWRKWPLGAWLLIGLALVVAVQAATGTPPRGRSDLLAYLPLLYAGAAMILFRFIDLPARTVIVSCIAGAMLSGGLMIATFALAPDFKWVRSQHMPSVEEIVLSRPPPAQPVDVGTPMPSGAPQQNVEAISAETVLAEVTPGAAPFSSYVAEGGPGPGPAPAETLVDESAPARDTAPISADAAALADEPEREEQEQPVGVEETPAARSGLDAHAFAPELDPFSAEMYAAKFGMRNALGFSNYIAVFLVAGFAIALFGSYKVAAVVLAVLTLATLSRFGLVFLAATFAVYVLSSRVRLHVVGGVLIAGVAAGVVALMLAAPLVEQIPQLASMTARIRFWESALPLLSADHLLGSPRSYFGDYLGTTVFWNPHNSVLWIWALFGFAGSLLYWGYIGLALHSVWRAAVIDPLWRGVFVALFVMIAWSLVEPIVLSPAFEILVAACYGLTMKSIVSSRTSRENAFLARSCFPSSEGGGR